MSFRGTHVIPSAARNLPPSRNVRGLSVIPAQAGIQRGRERDAHPPSRTYVIPRHPCHSERSEESPPFAKRKGGIRHSRAGGNPERTGEGCSLPPSRTPMSFRRKPALQRAERPSRGDGQVGHHHGNHFKIMAIMVQNYAHPRSHRFALSIREFQN